MFDNSDTFNSEYAAFKERCQTSKDWEDIGNDLIANIQETEIPRNDRLPEIPPKK